MTAIAYCPTCGPTAPVEYDTDHCCIKCATRIRYASGGWANEVLVQRLETQRERLRAITTAAHRFFNATDESEADAALDEFERAMDAAIRQLEQTEVTTTQQGAAHE